MKHAIDSRANEGVDGDTITLDRATHRHKDENGFLHVAVSHISKETVNPYYGREIPGWRDEGLDPEKIYQGYRKGDELQKGAETFNGLPLLLGHFPESADEPQKEHRVGSLGTDAVFDSPYLNNSLIITDTEAIKAIESGRAVELSSAYRYTPVFESGVFGGEHYDFVMTNIRGNHVALVEEGRAGPDVAVADERINPNPKRNLLMGIKVLARRLLTKNGLAADNAEVAEAAEQFVEAIGEEVVEKALEAGPSSTFDEEAGKILADSEMDEPGKIAAFKKLAEGLKESVGKGQPGESAKGADNGADENSTQKKEEDISGPCAAKMKEAGLDPSDEVTVRAFTAGMKAASTASYNDATEQAKDGEQNKEGEEKPLTAQDAATIRTQAKQEATTATKEHLRSLASAARSVRGLCGEIDPFAFDSAADIYRHALKTSGVSVTTRDVSALEDMVGMALDAKEPSVSVALFDSAKMEGPFTGLSRITLQH